MDFGQGQIIINFLHMKYVFTGDIYTYCLTCFMVNTCPRSPIHIHMTLTLTLTFRAVLPLVRPLAAALVGLPQVHTLPPVLTRPILAAVAVAAAWRDVDRRTAQPFLGYHQLRVHKQVPQAADEALASQPALKRSTNERVLKGGPQGPTVHLGHALAHGAPTLTARVQQGQHQESLA